MKKTTVILVSVVVLYVAAVVYHSTKPLPEGVNVEGDTYMLAENDVRFLSDRTYLDEDGERRTEQEIFDAVLARIQGAQSFVLIDMFLYNDLQGAVVEDHREISEELTDALIEKQRDGVTVVVITDPINTLYGGAEAQHLSELREAGATVILTDLKPLRDSNPLYSTLWRSLFRWWGNSTDGWLSHPFDPREDPVTLRTYLSLFNFKANHRKVMVADGIDDGRQRIYSIIISANPHDGSSAHGNVGLEVGGFVWRDIVETERAVAAFSERSFELGVDELDIEEEPGEDLSVQLLTEGAIKRSLLQDMETLGEGDRISMAMFYLSERDVIRGILDASERGVDVRLVLDPNRDAFGREKDGTPNRQVAHELREESDGAIDIRWCNTHGEQCHSKLVILEREGGEVIVHLGSANLTRRNIGDFNLESNVRVAGNRSVELFRDIRSFFNERWENREERGYTVPYSAFTNDSTLDHIRYRIMERSGLSSF